MAWRVVKSLDQLLAQINARAPGRSKASDGSIGDAAHQAGTSDHNPTIYAALGIVPVVCARDFTQDPARGADMGPIAEAIRLRQDRRVAYVILKGRIFSNHAVVQDGRTYAAWEWRPYKGSDPHTNHMHVSTVHTAAADDTTPWQISATPAATGDDDMADSWTQPLTQGTAGYAGQQRDTALAFAWQAGNEAAAGVGKLLAAAEADEVRDKAALAAIQALATNGGVDEAPIVAAINAVRDEARQRFAELADQHTAEMAARAQDHAAEVAGLRAELAALGG